MIPTTIETAPIANKPLSFTLPVKKHAIRTIAPITTSIKPKFFKNAFIMILSFYLFNLYSCYKGKHNSLKGEIFP